METVIHDLISLHIKTNLFQVGLSLSLFKSHFILSAVIERLEHIVKQSLWRVENMLTYLSSITESEGDNLSAPSVLKSCIHG